MLAGLIALAAAAIAPPPAPPGKAPPPPPAKAPPPVGAAGGAPSAAALRGAAAMKALGMSDAGIAVLRKQSAPDPDARALIAKRQALRAQLAQAAAANPTDVDAIAALLRDSSTLEASVRTRSEERIVTTLKALPPADRPIFAKAVFAGPPAPPGPPPAPPRP